MGASAFCVLLTSIELWRSALSHMKSYVLVTIKFSNSAKQEAA